MEKSPDAFRTISEVSEILETPAHVLRFWESRFPQVRPVKRAGGRRYYRPSDVALLSGIRVLLHDQGLTIRGVQKILREQGVRHVALIGGAAGAGAAVEDADLDDVTAPALWDEGAQDTGTAPSGRGAVIHDLLSADQRAARVAVAGGGGEGDDPGRDDAPASADLAETQAPEPDPSTDLPEPAPAPAQPDGDAGAPDGRSAPDLAAPPLPPAARLRALARGPARPLSAGFPDALRTLRGRLVQVQTRLRAEVADHDA